MKRLVSLSMLLCLVGLSCFAQQDPSSSLYMYKTAIYNPGAIGIDGLFNITASSRKQWVGFEGAPFTASFNANAPI
ncbi:MAG: type IX secretion system membrane protein PorP/SprF, partial [Bacteroidales bacterium]|nr:type IX secretion system membrane protein PorP/SprF [Bacteroidales bacterium]